MHEVRTPIIQRRNNVLQVWGAGNAFYSDNPSSGSSIISFAGNTKIFDNYGYDKTTDAYIEKNIFFSTESTNIPTITGKLYKDINGVRDYAKLGLSLAAKDQLTKGYISSGNTASDVAKIFFADNNTQAVAYNGNGEIKYVTATTNLKNLTYDSNDENGQTSAVSVVDEISVEQSKFVRNGYAFSHWNTKADNSGISYKPNDIISITSNTTLYAQWTKKSHPAHYTDGKIEVIDFIEDKKLNFHRGNAVKYIARAGKKDPDKEIEDLKKAVWYITREIERLTKQHKDNAEHCVACGDVIPEGRQICPQCERGAIIGVDLADKSDASHGGL